MIEKTRAEKDAARLAKSLRKCWMSHKDMREKFGWDYARTTNALHICSLSSRFDVTTTAKDRCIRGAWARSITQRTLRSTTDSMVNKKQREGQDG